MDKKKLDADPKGIQEVEFVRKLHNNDGENADGTQSLFILTASEKNQRNVTKNFAGKCKVLWEMTNYPEGSVRLTNTQLSKLKSTAKIKKL